MRAKGQSTVADAVSRSSRGRSVFTGIVVLVVLAILLSLGTWQVQRLYWKEALIAELADRIHQPPVPLADMEALKAGGGDVDYRPMQATGRFDHTRERHFLATWQGQSGFDVYTPLVLADGRNLLVNRGFVPYDKKDPQTRAAGQVSEEVTVAGLARARLDAKPSFMVPENDPKKNIFYWKDLDVMASSTGLDAGKVVPFFLDADAKANPGNLPIGGVTLVEMPNSHLQYAVTWYGLAAVLLIITAVSWRRSRKG